MAKAWPLSQYTDCWCCCCCWSYRRKIWSCFHFTVVIHEWPKQRERATAPLPSMYTDATDVVGIFVFVIVLLLTYHHENDQNRGRGPMLGLLPRSHSCNRRTSVAFSVETLLHNSALFFLFFFFFFFFFFFSHSCICRISVALLSDETLLHNFALFFAFLQCEVSTWFFIWLLGHKITLLEALFNIHIVYAMCLSDKSLDHC